MNLEISLRSHIKLVSDGRQVTRRKWSQNTQVQPNPYGSCFVQSGDDFISLVIPSNKLVLIAIKEWGITVLTSSPYLSSGTPKATA